MTIGPSYIASLTGSAPTGPAPTGPSYLSYVQQEIPALYEAANSTRQRLMEELAAQQMKNSAAPVVGGSSSPSGGSGFASGTNTSASSYSGKFSNQFKTVGGKVVPVSGRVSQGWGKSRIHYAAGRHTGMDFGVPIGTTVKSAGNGIVTYVGRDGAYGNVVKVRQADGTYALYGHLSGYGVKPGQRVKAGQRIARSGNSGRSTGAHLHFEIRTRDRYSGDINPVSWLRR